MERVLKMEIWKAFNIEHKDQEKKHNQLKEKYDTLHKTVQILFEKHMDNEVKKEIQNPMDNDDWDFLDNEENKLLGAETKYIIEWDYRKIITDIRSSSKKVYSSMDWGWCEGVYQGALKMELDKRGYRIFSEVTHPIYYEGEKIGDGFSIRTDLIVEDRETSKKILLELKAVSSWIGAKGVDKAPKKLTIQQCRRYLRMTDIDYGMIINFPNVEIVQEPEMLIVYDGILSIPSCSAGECLTVSPISTPTKKN